MRELITLLMETAYNFGGFVCNDLESDFPLPTEEIRRTMKHHYALWTGEDENSLLFDEPFSTYSSLLGYFMYRLNPDMEAQIRQARHEKELR